jgi:hypothetical protein
MDLQLPSLVFSSIKTWKIAGLPCLAQLHCAISDPNNTAIMVESNGITRERRRKQVGAREREIGTTKATNCKESVQREKERS